MLPVKEISEDRYSATYNGKKDADHGSHVTSFFVALSICFLLFCLPFSHQHIAVSICCVKLRNVMKKIDISMNLLYFNINSFLWPVVADYGSVQRFLAIVDFRFL